MPVCALRPTSDACPKPGPGIFFPSQNLRTIRIKNPCIENRKDSYDSSLQLNKSPLTDDLTAGDAENTPILVELTKLWPRLPHPARQAIIELARAYVS